MKLFASKGLLLGLQKKMAVPQVLPKRTPQEIQMKVELHMPFLSFLWLKKVVEC